VLRAHGAQGDAGDLLELAGLPASPRVLQAYPHQLSGGERQRVSIAQALACRPALVIADEPFTALDAVRVVELAALFRDLKEKTGSSFLVISHSPGVLARVADRVLVMQGGRIVEQGPPDTIFRTPAHPYTVAVLAAAERMAGRG
jgi:ABC-type dipeptide/oligopeptide/nickel transport system ATPase component